MKKEKVHLTLFKHETKIFPKARERAWILHNNVYEWKSKKNNKMTITVMPQTYVKITLLRENIVGDINLSSSELAWNSNCLTGV